LNFNVLDTLVQLRRQRPGMVQTKEQLIYWSVAPLFFTSLSLIHPFLLLFTTQLSGDFGKSDHAL